MSRSSRKKSPKPPPRLSAVDRFGEWLKVNEPDPKYDMLPSLAADFLRHIKWNPCDAMVLAAQYLQAHTEIAKPRETPSDAPQLEFHL